MKSNRLFIHKIIFFTIAIIVFLTVPTRAQLKNYTVSSYNLNGLVKELIQNDQFGSLRRAVDVKHFDIDGRLINHRVYLLPSHNKFITDTTDLQIEMDNDYYYYFSLGFLDSVIAVNSISQNIINRNKYFYDDSNNAIKVEKIFYNSGRINSLQLLYLESYFKNNDTLYHQITMSSDDTTMFTCFKINNQHYRSICKYTSFSQMRITDSIFNLDNTLKEYYSYSLDDSYGNKPLNFSYKDAFRYKKTRYRYDFIKRLKQEVIETIVDDTVSQVIINNYHNKKLKKQVIIEFTNDAIIYYKETNKLFYNKFDQIKKYRRKEYYSLSSSTEEKLIKETSNYKYEYDRYGNWIKETVYEGYKQVDGVSRVIIYYP